MILDSNNINPDDLHILQRQARSKIKFDAIVDIIEICRDDVFNHPKLESHKWEWIGAGLYKECWARDSIVVKFAKHDDPAHQNNSLLEIIREYDQWINPPDLDFRKHLSRTYAIVDGEIIIQDKVMLPCATAFNVNRGFHTCCFNDKLYSIANKYELTDFISNHGHTPKGNIVFFDSVWRRSRNVDF